MKIGLSIKLDVKKIDKNRLFKGEKGVYLDLTTFVDTDNQDQYQNNGFVSQSVSKEERENGVQTPILGNIKVFYTDNQNQNTGYQQSQPQNQNSGYNQQPPDNSDIPF